MRSRQLASIFLLAAALLACSGVRETRPLAYPGDARTTSEPIAEVVKKRGFHPICSPREFCKFAYNDRITIHFKLKPDQVVIAVDVAGGKDLPPAELRKLLDEGMKVGEEIFNEARPAALALEEEAHRAQAAADKEEAARRAQEAARQEEEARRARELAAQQPAAPAPAPPGEPPAAPPAPALAPVAPPEVTPEIKYSDDFGRTAFQFREPEGTVCDIAGDNVWAGTKKLEVPFRMEALKRTYYTFECKLPSGAVWRKKLEAKDGSVTVVRLLTGGAPAPGSSPR